MAEIIVKEIKHTKSGNIKAFVMIQIGNTVFHDFRIIKDGDKAAWVSPPVSSWKDDSGKVHYKSLIEFPKELKQKISDAILEAYSKEA